MKFIKHFLLICIFLSSFAIGQAPKLSVRWQSTFYGNQDLLPKKNIFQNLVDIIAGDSNFKFERPVSVVSFGKSKLAVLDQQLKSIFIIDSLSNKIQIFSGFPSLVSAASDSFGNVYFTDSQLNQVYIYNEKTKAVKILNEQLVLMKPTGIAYSDKDATLWLAETGKHQILQLNTEGQILKRIGARGSEQGQFNFPTHICTDSTGNVYVVDAMNFRVQIFDKKGTFKSTFGSAGDASGYLARPKGISVDRFGNIYLADALFHTIQIFDKNGNYLSSIGKQGQENGSFWIPNGISINSNIIWVADSYNKRIQKFNIYSK